METNSIPQEGYGTPAHPGPRTAGDRDDDNASSGKDVKKGGKKVGSSSDGFMVNPMVNVWKFDDKFMTTTDQNLYIEFDPDAEERFTYPWAPDVDYNKRTELDTDNMTTTEVNSNIRSLMAEGYGTIVLKNPAGSTHLVLAFSVG